MSEIKQLSSKVVYRNKWMTVREDVVQRQSGVEGIYGVVEKNDYALILPVAPPHIYVVEQYRYAIGKRSVELPQGTVDADAGHATKKNMADIAALELAEETGIVAGELLHIGTQYLACGYSNQKYHIFVAKSLSFHSQRLEAEEEGLVCRKMTIDDFEQRILDGKIMDSASVTAFFLARHKGLV